MADFGEAFATGSVHAYEKHQGIIVYSHDDPTQPIPVRLSDGTTFYIAGSSSSSIGQVSQGDSGSLNKPWPVLLASGGLAVGTSTVGGALALKVDVVAGSAGGPSKVDDAAFSIAVDSVAPMGALFDDTGTDSVDEGDVGIPRMTGNRILYAMGASGSVTGLLQGGVAVSAANPVPVSVSSATIVSGSVAGLLVGGVALSNANPVPMSDAGSSISVDDGGGSLTVDGTVTVSSATVVSGSVVGLLQGGLNVSNANPIPISDAGGSLTVDGTVIVSSATVVSGSVTGLLVGGQPHSSTNPLYVDGFIDQGTAGTLAGGWPVKVTDGTNVLGDSTNPLVVRAASGSITGLLVGGLNVSNANPVPISDAGGSLTVDGTVTVASTVINSGSVTGLLVGGVALSAANPMVARLVDGAGDSAMDDTNNAVRVNIVAGAGSGGTAMTDDAAFTVGSTSFTPAGGTYKSTRDTVDDNDGGAFAMTQRRALLTAIETPDGDTAMDDVNNALRVNIVAGAGSGGTAMTDGALFTTGSTSFTPAGGFYTSSRDNLDSGDGGAFSMTQKRALYTTIETPLGDSAMDDTLDAVKAVAVSGSMTGLLQGGLAVSTANPVPVSVSSATIVSGSVTGLLVGGVALSNANPVPISDAGGSITIDGAVTLASTVINSGSVTGLLVGGQPLRSDNAVPVGLVAPDGDSLVNAVENAVYVYPSLNALFRVDNDGSAAGSTNPFSVRAFSGSVTGLLVGGVALSNANPVPISDAGGIITVDGTVTVTSTVINSGSVTGLLVGGVAVSDANGVPSKTFGDVAHGTADSGNPVKVGFRAYSGSLPTAEATNDRVNGIADRYGRQIVSCQIDPAQQTWKAISSTGSLSELGRSVWIPPTGSAIAITHFTIGSSGTAAGRLILWFGAGNDTTYTEGTDQCVFDAEFAPSATTTPGAVVCPPVPIFSQTHTKTLKVSTTLGALAYHLTVYGYEFTP